MDSASDVFSDLEVRSVRSVAEMKSLLRKQHTQLIAQGEHLVANNAEIFSHMAQIEALKLQIFKLCRLQFGQRSEKRAQLIG